MSILPNLDQSKKGSKVSVILRVVVTILALSLVGYLVWKEDWGQIIKQSEKVFGLPLLWAVLLMAGSRIFTALRWYVLLGINENRPSLKEILKINFSGLFGANFLPSTVGGDILRLSGGMKHGLGGSFTAASLIVDRLIGLVGMLFFFPYGLAVILPQIDQGLNAANLNKSLAVSPFLQRFLNKVLKVFKSVIAAFKLWIKKPVVLLYSLILTLGHTFMLFGVMWVLLSASGEQITFWRIGGLWTFVYLVSLIPISINGLGVQEISITYVFTNFGGIEQTNALVFALLLRVLFTALSLPGALFVKDLIPEKRDESPD